MQTAEGLSLEKPSCLESSVGTAEGYVAGGRETHKTHNKSYPMVETGTTPHTERMLSMEMLWEPKKAGRVAEAFKGPGE